MFVFHSGAVLDDSLGLSLRFLADFSCSDLMKKNTDGSIYSSSDIPEDPCLYCPFAFFFDDEDKVNTFVCMSGEIGRSLERSRFVLDEEIPYDCI